jgi:hypothetical protein
MTKEKMHVWIVVDIAYSGDGQPPYEVYTSEAEAEKAAHAYDERMYGFSEYGFGVFVKEGVLK